MRSSRCLFNSATALHRIFIAPIESSHRPLIARSAHAPFPNHLLTQRRNIIVARAAGTDPAKSRLPRDEEITAYAISVVAADGKLQAPRRTREVLASIDRKTHMLVMVVPAEAGAPPLCKIVDKKKEWAAAKARKKQQSGGGPVPTKTVELNWAIEQGDLTHRLGRVREFLEKGHKVEIVLAKKRKGRLATEEEARAVLTKVKEAVEEVGAKETKPMEGKLLGTATIYTEGKLAKK